VTLSLPRYSQILLYFHPNDFIGSNLLVVFLGNSGNINIVNLEEAIFGDAVMQVPKRQGKGEIPCAARTARNLVYLP